MNIADLKTIAFAARAKAKAARACGTEGAKLEALYAAEAAAFRAFHAARKEAALPSENQYGWQGSVLDATATVAISGDAMGFEGCLNLSGETL